jgi:hypothetical protein
VGGEIGCELVRLLPLAHWVGLHCRKVANANPKVVDVVPHALVQIYALQIRTRRWVIAYHTTTQHSVRYGCVSPLNPPAERFAHTTQPRKSTKVTDGQRVLVHVVAIEGLATKMEGTPIPIRIARAEPW